VLIGGGGPATGSTILTPGLPGGGRRDIANTFGFFNTGPGNVTLDLVCSKTAGNGTFSPGEVALTAIKVGTLQG
jgi:hypothetical protein